MKYLIILLLISATSLITCLITQRAEKQSITQNYILLDSLEQRVYADFGEGDAGTEEFYYLKTGKHIELFGKVNPHNYDYHICLTDSFTIVYDVYGKFIDRIPKDTNSIWDRALNNIDNP